jgi:tetraacyldisaccharide 4'-kinase
MPDLAYEIVYPRGGARLFRALPDGAPALAMRPASFLYERISGAVRSARTRRRRPLDVGAVVVSVGNLEVGGNGKTPFVIHLVNELGRRGYRPLVASRGYKSAAETLSAVTVLAPRSAELKGRVSTAVRVLRDDAGGLAEAIGDEGAMVLARCPGVPLAFSGDRRRAVEVGCALFEPTHVVLDDGFQTWGVERDVDIVLLDAERPLGNGRILPSGSLRERPNALRRADVVGFNALERDEHLAGLTRWVCETVGRPIPVFGVRRHLSFLEPPSGEPAERPAGQMAVLSSVGRPHRFETSLAAAGITIGLSLRFPDHFRYARDDIQRIDALLNGRGIDRLVTTEKDWVKLRDVGPTRARVWVARLELALVGIDPVRTCEKPQASPAASA